MSVVRTLFNRRWWWTTLLVIAGMAFLARLGLWQLDRLDQRRAANAALAAQLAAPPLDANSADAWPADLAAWRNRQVTAVGVYDEARQVVLTQQRYSGRLGAHLLTPLRLTDDTAVLVDRGWVPSTAAAPDSWPPLDELAQRVDGYLQATESRGDPAPADWRQEWFRVDVAAIDAQLPYDLLPFYIRAAPGPSPDVTPPIRVAPDLDLSEGPHLSYALQWFSFSLMFGVGYLFFVRRQTRVQEKNETAVA